MALPARPRLRAAAWRLALGLRRRAARRALAACAVVAALGLAGLAPGPPWAGRGLSGGERAAHDQPGVDVGLLVSKALSLGVIAGSFVGKLPQVHQIWKAHSAHGVSAISIWTEAVSMGIQFAYNVVRRTPLSTYAEVPVLFAQMLLLAVVAAWADQYLDWRIWLSCCGLVLATWGMMVRIIPTGVTLTLYAVNASLGLLIVGPQVLMNCRSKSTGRLSFVVTAMTFCGLSTRLYTTLIEVEDPVLRATVLLNWSLTALLMLQFHLYQPSAVPDDGDKMVVQTMTPSTSWARGLSEDTQGSLTTEFRKVDRQISVVECMGKIASFHCLTDLVDGEEPVLSSVLVRGGNVKSFSDLRSLTFFDRKLSEQAPALRRAGKTAPELLETMHRCSTL